MQTKKPLNKQFNLSQHACMRIMLTCLISGAFSHAHALPLGEQVQAGNVGFVRDGQSLNINQTSQQAIVNWQSFGIAASEAVRLIQPNQGSALFRVTGSDPSQIFGSLSATGSLFLVNPNGVLFAPGAQVNVGSLVATTMQINDQDFLAKRYRFSGDSEASVVNKGVIKTSDGGYIVLLGEQVENSGSLIANQGSVVLGSAQSALLDFYGDGLVQVKLSGDALAAAVSHTGNIMADGGSVQLATQARTAALNVDGVVQANSLVSRNGFIRLEGGTGSKVKVTGRLEARGDDRAGRGGEIAVTGEQLALLDTAVIDVSGQAGGGTVLIGGDYQGKNTALHNARTTYVGSGVAINANAINEGNGGKVVVWSDDTTRYYGNISALGGAVSGNGGFVEVSGKQNLDFNGGIKVAAANGIGGFILLDPQDILLNTSTQPSPSNNANGTPDIAFADAPVAGTTTVQIAEVTGYSELFLQATRDITVANAITMGANNSIRLEANNNITLNVGATMTVSGTGSINLKADADNSGVGALTLNAGLVSRQGGIMLSGASITGAAAGSITTTGAANLNGGNVSISSTGGVSLLGAVTANGGAGAAATAGGNAGNVTVTAAGTVTTAAINATGGTAGAGNVAGGNAGTINISTNVADITTGALTARTGVASGTGAGSLAGSISVTNTATAGNVTLGSLTTSGNANGSGGNINVVTTGLLTLNGAIASTGGANVAATTQAGKRAGTITLTGNGGISTLAAATINANGGAGLGVNQAGGNAGAVILNSSGTIVARAINSQTGAATGTGAGGATGGITVTGAAVTTGNLTTTGNANGHAGSISAVSTTGNLTVGAIAANGGTAQVNTSGRNAAAVTLNSAGTVTATTIAANGSAGNGALGNFSGGNGAAVSIAGVGGVTASSIAASGGAATTSNANGGNAGSITLANSGAGDLVTTTLTSQAGAATGTGAGGAAGSVSVNNSAATGNISTTNITTTGTTNAHGGNVSLSSLGNTTIAGTINTSGGAAGTGATAAGRNAGNVTITGVNRSVTGAITSSGAAGLGANQAGGNAGLVSITGAGTLSTAAVTSRTGNATGAGAGGVAGGVTLSGSSVSSTAINTAGGTAGNGGNVNVTTTGLGASSITSVNANNLGAVSLNVADTLTVSGIIAGTNSTVTKSGSGTLLLSGANTYTGLTTINAGTLRYGANNAISTGAVTVNDGGTYDLAGFSDTIGALTVNSGITGGTVSTGTGTLTLGGNVTTTGGANNALISGNLALGTAARTFTSTNATDGLTVAAVVSGAVGLNKAGNGTLTLSGANTYTGATLINAGTLSAAHANALGAVGTGTTVANGAALNVNNISLAAEPISINGAGVGGIGALTATGAAIVTGNVTTAGNSLIGATSASSSLTLNGIVTATNNLGIVGAGDVIAANAANNFSTVNINGANNVSLRDVNAIVLGNGASNLTGNLTVQAGGNVTVANNISTSAGDITLAGTNFINNAGASALTAGGRWLVYANSHTGNTFGSLSSGNQAIWGTTYPAAVSQTGNRYVFANSPSLTVTSNNQSKTYGQNGAPVVANSFTATGFVNAATFGNVFSQDMQANTVTGSAVSAGSAITANVGSYLIDVTPVTATTGYSLSKINSGNLAVNQAVISLSGTRTYNGTTVFDASDFGTFLTGINGETLNVAGLGSVTNANAGAAQMLTPSSIALADGTGVASNYTMTGGTHTGTINKANITVSTADVTKTYDGSLSAIGATTVSAGTLFNNVSNGNALDSLSGGSFAFINANAGIGNKTVTVSGVTVTDGNGGNNYNVGFADNIASTINQANITVSTSDVTKTYDGSLSAIGAATVTTGNLFNNVSNGGVLDNLTGGAFAYTDKNAGLGNKTVTVGGVTVNDGNGGNNYNISFGNNTTSTINQANLSLSAVTDSRTYNALTSSGGLVNIAGLQGTDTITGLSQSFDSKNAGARTLTVDTGFTVNDGNSGLNYNTVLNTAAGSITQRAITVTSSPDSKTYDGNISSAVTPSITAGSIMAEDSGVFSQIYDNENTGVGKSLTSIGSIADGNGGNNYAVTFIANNTGVINPRALIVTADAGQNKIIGTTDPLPFSFTVGGLGLVGGDTLFGALNRVAGEGVGHYAINQGSLDAGSNYLLSYIGNNFTIIAASLDNTGNNSNPRASAGLVDWNPMLGNYTNRQLFVLNLGFTAAGNEANGHQADLPNCEANPDSLAKDKDYILMLNYGLKLPQGLSANCI
ncbi:filamentous hemagglutinin N-terminal domain-containing protein [Methylotenera sp.]|uniref:filamentous hemagglutinin N-terminal domain-containing protein n=1 Tax=Methylotenera sp. TaxID=2051956 RepID=UPI002731C2B1|nr:filamentous hemagglutinin N-terminal domain-containing protein [Methylotenera sp.]MDP2229777.1 filamentous hemagglutinin N-terminal domain-containing protein [Methylotenera sp.]MDP3140458.1 filamentous hemagglutinin N-terminal domain-containing protein [Methylotenera sp.]